MRKAHNPEAILVVDDTEQICELVQEFLRPYGFAVFSATGGREAVETFRRNAAEIRVVLLDLMMPDMPGELVLRELQGIRPDVPVILLTGLAEEEAMGKVVGRPVAGFIAKPFDGATLIRKLREVLGG